MINQNDTSTGNYKNPNSETVLMLGACVSMGLNSGYHSGLAVSNLLSAIISSGKYALSMESNVIDSLNESVDNTAKSMQSLAGSIVVGAQIPGQVISTFFSQKNSVPSNEEKDNIAQATP